MVASIAALTLAGNALAGQITWTITEDSINGFTTTNFTFEGINYWTDVYDLVGVFLIRSESWPDIMFALENDMLSATTPGVLGAQMFIPGSAQVETYRTPDNHDIEAGQDYDVYFVIIGRHIDDILCDVGAYMPLNGKANSEDTLIFHMDGVFDVDWHMGYFSTPFTLGTVVPEPATGLLVLSGAAMLLLRRRRR